MKETGARARYMLNTTQSFFFQLRAPTTVVARTEIFRVAPRKLHRTSRNALEFSLDLALVRRVREFSGGGEGGSRGLKLGLRYTLSAVEALIDISIARAIESRVKRWKHDVREAITRPPRKARPALSHYTQSGSEGGTESGGGGGGE